MKHDYPVDVLRFQIIQAVNNNKAVVVVGETGSGKTTQIPQYLMNKNHTVAVTQPRRLAAISLAKRVSAECGVILGKDVGYSVRFERKCSNKTRLKYLTDGMLLREICSGNIGAYSAIVIDEAHERTTRTDILLGLIKQEQAKRDLKVIVMSASIDPKRFSRYFHNAPVVVIPGKMYPVKIIHLTEQTRSYLESVIDRVLLICREELPGDVLVFLTGKEELERVKSVIEKEHRVCVFVLYSKIELNRQQRALKKVTDGTRKIILATNIAETSLTIKGVSYVVDSCRVKKRLYRDGIEQLSVQLISKAEAIQRAGRAGRIQSGKCFRMLTEKEFSFLSDEPEPEIKNGNLSEAVLLLGSINSSDFFNFPFLDKPSPSLVKEAFLSLFVLGGLDTNGKISQKGRQMAIFPLSPEHSAIIIGSEKLGCTEEAILVVSAISSDVSFVKGKRTSDFQGDHLAWMDIIRSDELSKRDYEKVQRVRKQLRLLCVDLGMSIKSCGEAKEKLVKSLLCGYPLKIGRCKNGKCRTIKGMRIEIHPSSVLYSETKKGDFWFVFNEIILTTRHYVSVVTKIREEWIPLYGGVLYSDYIEEFAR